jgi:homoserine O-acetyltransferase (EC 2.3.1.31)
VRDFLDNGLDGRAITDTAGDDEASEADGGDTDFAPVHSSLFSG